MPAALRTLDSDGSTVITTVNLGNLATPGTSANKKLFVQNFGTVTAQSVTLEIEAVGTNDGNLYLQTAPDVSGSPGTFAQTTITMGDIAVLATVAFWIRVVLPSGLTADDNPRRANLVASGLTT
jgi:hypothetical protein